MESEKDPFEGKKLADFKGDEREPFLKSVYDYCEQVGYDIKRTTSQTRIWARAYIRDYLGLSEKEVKEKLKQVNSKVENSSREARHNRGGRCPKFNPVFLKKGIQQKTLWENEEQKEEVLKYIYDFLNNANYSTEATEQLEDAFGLGGSSICRYSKMYATEYLKMTSEDFNELKFQARKKQNKPETYGIFEELLACDEAERVTLLKNSGFSMGLLYDRAYNWAVSYGKWDNLKIVRGAINCARQSMREVNKSIRERQKEQEAFEMLPLARKIVLNFIANPEKISDFCDKNKIEQAEFKKMVSIVQTYDCNLFDQYTDTTNRLQAQRFTFLLQTGKSILQQLTRGVALSDGTTRKFDIIDYLLATNLPYNEMLSVLKSGNVPEKDIRPFRIFMSRNKIGTEWAKKEIENTLNNQHIIGIQFDSNNNMIPGSGHELTKEEKTNIMNYVKTQDIPLCNETYRCALKRYQNGYLTFDEKGKVKKLKI